VKGGAGRRGNWAERGGAGDGVRAGYDGRGDWMDERWMRMGPGGVRRDGVWLGGVAEQEGSKR